MRYARNVRTREERLEENQDRFRRANERLDSAVGNAVEDGTLIPFVCECPDDLCLSRTDLTRAEYADIRSHENRYVIVPGHPTAPGENVLDDKGRFAVVEKGP